MLRTNITFETEREVHMFINGMVAIQNIIMSILQAN